MALKDGIVGEFMMYAFLGAFAVLVLTNANSFSTAITAGAGPIEQETALIATAGKSATPTASSKGKGS